MQFEIQEAGQRQTGVFVSAKENQKITKNKINVVLAKITELKVSQLRNT